MRRWPFSTKALLLALVLPAGLAAACGARSELEIFGVAAQGKGGEAPDAGIDAPVDAPVDAPMDAPIDAPFPNECEDPETETYIYVFTSQNELHAFKPETHTFELRGPLTCPAGPGSSPFSMAVSRSGIAYVLYRNAQDMGELFRASVLDAACEATPFVPGQLGFNLFGMGFEPNQDDDGETLHVVEISFSQPPLGLGRIDLDTFELSFVGPLSHNPGHAIELTPTGDGPLWGYFLDVPGPGGTLVEIDTSTAEVTQSIDVDNVGNGSSSLAVSWWGGAFYIFVDGVNGGTDVHRYDPTTKQAPVVASFALDVVGAGVSTCAPAALP